MPLLVKSLSRLSSQCSLDVVVTKANPFSLFHECPRKTDAKCNMLHSSFYKDHQVLASNSIHKLILPQVMPMQPHPIHLEYGRCLKGDHFQVYLGVIDTDSVKDLG